MGDQDYAIVVGIDTYFDSENFPKLKGPENDAREFYDWVTSSTGGAVPGKNALRVLSSEFRQPFQSLVDAKPTAKEIVAVFDAVFRVAGENAERGIGYKVGRRVYLFFAGHGFAPSHRQDQTALVVADADPSTSQLAHVLGTYMADALYHRKFFEEVFLFMDCCRSSSECAQLFMPFPEETANDYWKVRRFYGFGARAGKDARERDFGGRVHGVFTRTLLDGLRGAAYDPDDPGTITAESLQNHLYNAYPSFMDPELRDDPDVPNEPEVDFERKPRKLVVGKVPPGSLFDRISSAVGIVTRPKYPVRVGTTTHVGKEAQILNRSLEVVEELTLAAQQELSLDRGLYAVLVAGVPAREFEVTGVPEGIDVAL